MLILSNDDVESILDPKNAVRIAESVYRERGLGRISMPPRPWIELERYGCQTGLMPAYLELSDSIGFKVVSVYREPEHKVKAFITLIDPERGEPLSLMDGESITAFRTGALAAVAADKLSRRDSRVVMVYGSGTQAKAQLRCLMVVRRIEEGYAYSPTPEHLMRFTKEMSDELNVEVKPTKDPDDAVGKADIIVAATTSKTPVFKGELVKEGAHINGIGSYTPDAQEIDLEVVRRSKRVFVDYKEDAVKSGDIRKALESGVITIDSVIELGDLVVGNVRGRTSDDEVTFFKSVGAAMFDVATASWVYHEAVKRGVGREI
jgi:ornithine cyclodeaminase